jgi:hypothetical protein
LPSAVVDLAFQIVLDGEEDWSGLTEEERAWEEENRGEVNMPPFPPQARMGRQLGDGAQKIAKFGSLPNGGIKRTRREEDQRVNWMNAGDPLTSDALGNFQQGAKPAAAFSNNLRPGKGRGAQSAPLLPTTGQIPLRTFQAWRARCGSAKITCIAKRVISSAFAGFTHDPEPEYCSGNLHPQAPQTLYSTMADDELAQVHSVYFLSSTSLPMTD